MKKNTQLFGTRMPQEFKEQIEAYIKKRQKIDMEFDKSTLFRVALKEYIKNHP